MYIVVQVINVSDLNVSIRWNSIADTNFLFYKYIQNV